MTLPVARGHHLPERRFARLGMEEIAAYVAVSGDDNPIHADPALARRAGLDGVPVPGLMVMAMMGEMIETWKGTGAVHRLSVNFVSPCYAGGDLRLTGRVVAVTEAGRTAVIRIVATQSGKPTAMGEAEIRVADTSEND